ncbi:hypothetical protein PSEUDO8AS_10522 [Pseudomonas sp. 8AS]|nr:hypothetical protein PSEUDO8AS_10522 [Pseudomonas sp. 8AS]
MLNLASARVFWYKAALFSRGPPPAQADKRGKTPEKRGAERQMTIEFKRPTHAGLGMWFRGLRHVESLSSYR